MMLRMEAGPKLISQAQQQFCAGKFTLPYISPGTTWNHGFVESFNNSSCKW